MRQNRPKYPDTYVDTPLTYVFLFCVASAGAGLVAILLRFTLDPLLAGTGVHDGLRKVLDFFLYQAWLVRCLGAFLTSVLVLLWQNQARRNLDKLHVRDLEHGTAWPLVAWFIPIVNWFEPYYAISEIWRASEPSVGAGGDWRSAAPTAPTKAWWATRVGAALSLPLLLGIGLIGMEIWVPIGVLLWLLVAALWLAFLLLTLRVVRGVSDRQARLYERIVADRREAEAPGG
jgi:hypothetical protein